MTPASALLRFIDRGRIWWAMPHWVVEETPERVVLALVPGAHGRQPRGSRADAVHQLASDQWDVGDLPWHTTRVIRIMPFDAAHAIELWWEHATDRFLFWKSTCKRRCVAR
jgi:hypothetical protein